MRHIRVLIVEDNERDCALLLRELRRGGYDVAHERVDTEAAMQTGLVKQSWDIVLSDYSLPHFSAKAALATISKSGVELPCVVVSGSVGEEAAVEVMRLGAKDLVLKHDIKRLLPAIARELDAAQMRRERSEANAKLDFERQLFQQLMKSVPDAICFKDVNRRYLRLNDAEAAYLDIDDAKLALGRTAEDFVTPALAQKRRAQEEALLATGEALLNCTEQIVNANKKVRWFASSKAPMRDADGKIVGIVEIARDITESKRQEQLKDEFIATVSHELRTPLTSIMGSIGLLTGTIGESLPDKVKHMLEVAYGNCKRLVRIVNDILDMEKIESGAMIIDRKPIEVLALVEQVVDANQGMAAEYRVSLRLDRAARRATVLTDPDRLAQVVTNLISNAIKFSPRLGDVSVSTRQDKSCAYIDIRDHGPGIPDDYKEKIFDKFVQVDAADNRQKGGTGLGLSIAKQIIVQLGGEIGFQSPPDGGTIFSARLPLFEPCGGRNRNATDRAARLGETFDSDAVSPAPTMGQSRRENSRGQARPDYQDCES